MAERELKPDEPIAAATGASLGGRAGVESRGFRCRAAAPLPPHLGRIGFRGNAAATRADGLGRLPASARRRIRCRGCVPSHVPGTRSLGEHGAKRRRSGRLAPRCCREGGDESERAAARRRHYEEQVAEPEADRSIPETTWDALLAAVHEEVQRLPASLRTAFILCELEAFGSPRPLPGSVGSPARSPVASPGPDRCSWHGSPAEGWHRLWRAERSASVWRPRPQVYRQP